MNKNTPKVIWAGVLLLALLALGAALPPEPGDSSREIGRTTERELNVVLTATFGTVVLSRGEPEKVVIAEALVRDKGPSPMTLSYDVRNRIGYLDMTLGEEGEHREEGKKSSRSGIRVDGGEWKVRLTDAVPVSIDMELGVGNGTIDLTGLQVRDFNLQTGAGDITLAFDAPNTTVMENMSIESGVSRFVGRNLGNANFRRLHFQGGMGSYELDFGGALTGEVDVDIDLGVGLMTLIVPGDVGVSVVYEKNWTSKISYDGEFRAATEARTVSENYAGAKGKMNIRIESGMGSVKIRQR
jgi:predicted membrane protein